MSHTRNEGRGGCVPWEDHERLREAARRLIALYMADVDLDEAVAELEDAAGFSQQGGS